jgi:hypothetical protein
LRDEDINFSFPQLAHHPDKKPHLFLRNGVYPNFQTMQPPGYPAWATVKG